MDIKPQMIEFDRISGVNCVLLSLYRHKELRATELLREIKISQDTFYRRTGEWLEKNGLIEARPRVEDKSYVFVLTEKGEKIARHLAEIERLI